MHALLILVGVIQRLRSPSFTHSAFFKLAESLYAFALMPRSRRRANQDAWAILEGLGEDANLPDADVLKVLRTWRFKRNKTRRNVMQDGEEWIYSDTLGFVRDRKGRVCLTKTTQEHPYFMKMLCRWAAESPMKDFPFTSISLNFDTPPLSHLTFIFFTPLLSGTPSSQPSINAGLQCRDASGWQQCRPISDTKSWGF